MTGRIAHRQSTYWDLIAPSAPVRVHFVGKREHCYVEPEFDTYAVHTDHPLLLSYAEPWRGVYVSSRPDDPRALLERVALAIVGLVGPWRESSEFLNDGVDPLSVLEAGAGLFARAPRTIAAAVCAELTRDRVEFTVLGGDWSPPEHKALIAGRNFVVARDFRIEPLD